MEGSGREKLEAMQSTPGVLIYTNQEWLKVVMLMPWTGFLFQSQNLLGWNMFLTLAVYALAKMASNAGFGIQMASTRSWFFLAAQPHLYIIQRKLVLIHDILFQL